MRSFGAGFLKGHPPEDPQARAQSGIKAGAAAPWEELLEGTANNDFHQLSHSYELFMALSRRNSA